MYTISELAKSVDQSENFVRQHIYRGHLKPRKDGQQMYVTTEEALRWCKARGLTFSPVSVILDETPTPDKVGRVTVLGFRSCNGSMVNAFTLLRTRRRENLGPWKPVFSNEWRRENLRDRFSLFTLDAEIEQCEELVSAALSTGAMTLDTEVCRYDVFASPRLHWAYREHSGDYDRPFRSPFANHSAEIREYWSRDSKIRIEMAKALRNRLEQSFGIEALGFPIQDRPDRLGNLMVASAWDQLKCEVSLEHSGTFAFEILGDLRPGEYSATAWAAQNGDRFFRQRLDVKSGRSTIAQSIVADRIGFEIFRSSDGQCVDRTDVNLIRTISTRIVMPSGPTINLMDNRGNTIHAIDSKQHNSNVVTSVDDLDDVDSVVRSRNLGFHAYLAERTAQREHRLMRFGQDKIKKAVEHFLQLLAEDADQSNPVYLADRYFLRQLEGIHHVQLYWELLSAIEGRELRVLCTQSPAKHKHPWWKKMPERLARNLKVRCFHTNKQDKKPAFHDRYLITAEHETWLSHSLCGWAEAGVTFYTSPFSVYREETENFWSIPLESEDAPLFVEEYV